MPEEIPHKLTKVNAFFKKWNHKVQSIQTPVLIAKAFDPRQSSSHPQHNRFNAIWDTGATHTIITSKVVDICGLKPIDIIRMQTAAGECNSKVYLINLVLPNNVGFSNLNVCQCDIKGADVLIGMDLITRGDFAVSNFDNSTSFSFRIPSLEVFDFRNPPPHIKQYKPKPNEPCPCGSGRKYKKCCGIPGKKQSFKK